MPCRTIEHRLGRTSVEGVQVTSPNAVRGKAAIDHATLDGAIDALLARRGRIALALTDAAVRVPLPDDPRFADVPTLPGHSETVIDFAVPADRIAVVEAWQGAQAMGLGQRAVRLSSDPDRGFSYTLVDGRPRFGVFLGFLIPDDERDPADDLPARLIPTRPRTARLHKNLYGVITHVDGRVEAMLGWAEEELLGHRSLEFIHPDDHQRAIGQWLEMRATRQTKHVRVRHRCRDGSWLWVELANTFALLDDPDRLAAVCELTDISDEMAALDALQQREKLFRRLAESLPEGVFLVGRDRTIVYANVRLGTILGTGDARTLHDQLVTVAGDDRAALLGAIIAAVDERSDRQLEIEVLHPDSGALRWCLATVTALSDEEGLPGALVTLTDVTDSTVLREQLRLQATRDALTGCLNRSSAFAALQEHLDRAAGPVAVMFIDLNHFKAVNDTFGHAVGDHVLTRTAHRIGSGLGELDLVCRLGGDEFLVICPNISDPTEALDAARRIQRALIDTITDGDRTVVLSAAIGVTLATPGAPAQLMITQADHAMYRGKRHPECDPVYLGPLPAEPVDDVVTGSAPV
jgi:diguanylate cyclase (GGDEF)-like protein/PAS domain S-box-containing protein